MNDLPKILEVKSAPILFADDASVLISHASPSQFKNTLNEVYGLVYDWFKKNLLSFNNVKTNCINFTAKKDERDIGDIGTLIMSSNYTKFLGLTIECTLKDILKRLIKN
jgi:hypothetical protein